MNWLTESVFRAPKERSMPSLTVFGTGSAKRLNKVEGSLDPVVGGVDSNHILAKYNSATLTSSRRSSHFISKPNRLYSEFCVQLRGGLFLLELTSRIENLLRCKFFAYRVRNLNNWHTSSLTSHSYTTVLNKKTLPLSLKTHRYTSRRNRRC